jgi:hypothetical protein
MKIGDRVKTVVRSHHTGSVAKIQFLPPLGWEDEIRDNPNKGEFFLKSWFFGYYSVVGFPTKEIPFLDSELIKYNEKR